MHFHVCYTFPRIVHTSMRFMCLCCVHFHVLFMQCINESLKTWFRQHRIRHITLTSVVCLKHYVGLHSNIVWCAHRVVKSAYYFRRVRLSACTYEATTRRIPAKIVYENPNLV
jgi:hypothetical protein